jgi:hypothetical protein
MYGLKLNNLSIFLLLLFILIIAVVVGKTRISEGNDGSTPPPAVATTAPPAVATTTPPAVVTTTPPAVATTTPPAVAKTTPPAVAKTTPPAVAKTGPPVVAKTAPPASLPKSLPDAPTTNLQIGSIYEYGYYDKDNVWQKIGYITADGATTISLGESEEATMRVDITKTYNYGYYDNMGIWKSYEMYSYDTTSGVWINAGTSDQTENVYPTLSADALAGSLETNPDDNGSDKNYGQNNNFSQNFSANTNFSMTNDDSTFSFGNTTLNQIMTYLPYIPKIIGYINPKGDSRIIVPSANSEQIAQYYTNPPTINSGGGNGIGNDSGFALNLFSNNRSATATNDTNIDAGMEQNTNNNGIFANGLGSYSNSGVQGGNGNSSTNGGEAGNQSNDSPLSPPNGINTRVNRGQNQPVSNAAQGSNEAPSNLNYYNAIPSKEGNYVPVTTDFGAFGK